MVGAHAVEDDYAEEVPEPPPDDYDPESTLKKFPQSRPTMLSRIA